MLHTDPQDNLNCLLSGRKTFFLADKVTVVNAFLLCMSGFYACITDYHTSGNHSHPSLALLNMKLKLLTFASRSLLSPQVTHSFAVEVAAAV